MNIITEIANEYIDINSYKPFEKVEISLHIYVLNKLGEMGVSTDKLDFSIDVNDDLRVDINCHNTFTMNIFNSDRKSLERYLKLNNIFSYE